MNEMRHDFRELMLREIDLVAGGLAAQPNLTTGPGDNPNPPPTIIDIGQQTMNSWSLTASTSVDSGTASASFTMGEDFNTGTTDLSLSFSFEDDNGNTFSTSFDISQGAVSFSFDHDFGNGIDVHAEGSPSNGGSGELGITVKF